MNEGDTASLRVSLAAASEKEIEMSWVTQDGTAAFRSDYEKGSSMLKFAPGDLHKDLPVQIRDDDRDEVDETFQVLLFHNPEAKRQIGQSTVPLWMTSPLPCPFPTLRR